MKSYFLALIFMVVSNLSFAGSASCTDVSYVSLPGTYAAADPLCTIQAQVADADFGYVSYTLPEEPYVGQEFTLQENSVTRNDSGSYFDDDLQDWVYYSYDFTGGVGFTVPNQTYEIKLDESTLTDTVAIYTKGAYIKVVFDGTEWVYSDGSF